MMVASRSVIIGVFRDSRLANQANDTLKQTNWIADDSQIVDKKAHGLFGAFKNTRTSDEVQAEPLPDELAQVGLPDEQRQLYQHELAHGSSLVLVYPQSHLLEIRDILYRNGAYQVFIPFQVGGEQAIPIRREVPQVQKQIVDVGEIRIHKRVVTEEKTFIVPVTHEEVTIERVPLASALPPQQQQQTNTARTDEGTHVVQNTIAAPSSLQEEMLREEGTLRILVREERVFIQKEVVVIEEILVQKQRVQDTKHLVEPLKHEEVHVERVGKALVHETTTGEDNT